MKEYIKILNENTSIKINPDSRKLFNKFKAMFNLNNLKSIEKLNGMLIDCLEILQQIKSKKEKEIKPLIKNELGDYIENE